MPESISSRIKSAWNAFRNKDPVESDFSYSYSSSYRGSSRPDSVRVSVTNDRYMLAAIYNRIAMDVSAVDIKHVRLDEQDRYLETMDSDLNKCLTLSANSDQTNKNLIQDLVLSMLDEGVVALVPIDTNRNPYDGSFDVESLRVCQIKEWFPDRIKVSAYDENDGTKKDIIVQKSSTAIIENPMYSVMNEPNSTLKRLSRKMALLDIVDNQVSSGKLDLIIQLPYAIKSQARKEQAEARKQAIEEQLTDSKYGIAYIDSTEHITQLNSSLDNNLLKQIEYLTDMLYGQLGITKEILNGSADDKVMLNYYNRTIEPILSAITLEMKRKFLSKTAITQRQSIEFFNDPFKLSPVSDIAEIADKMTRNEIMSSNEIRQIIGLRPSADPNADALRNKNLNPTESVDIGAGFEGLDDGYNEEIPESDYEEVDEELPDESEDGFLNYDIDF